MLRLGHLLLFTKAAWNCRLKDNPSADECPRTFQKEAGAVDGRLHCAVSNDAISDEVHQGEKWLLRLAQDWEEATGRSATLQSLSVASMQTPKEAS